MKAFVRLLAAVWAIFCFTDARAEPPELVLVEVSELDGEDTARLRELLDRPLRVIRLSDPAADAVLAARNAHSAEALILDRTRGRVSLVRAGASEVWVRTTQLDLVPQSSYAVSFVAAELLTLSAQLDAEHARRFGLARVWLRVGAQTGVAGIPYRGVWQPALGLGGLWARSGRPMGMATELVGAFVGRTGKHSEFGEIQLTASALQIRCGAFYRRHKFTLLGLGQLGLGIQRAVYTGPGGVPTRYFSSTLAAGMQLQGSLSPWFSLFAEAFAGVNARRADYAVQGASALREGPWFAQAGVGLALALPTR